MSTLLARPLRKGEMEGLTVVRLSESYYTREEVSRILCDGCLLGLELLPAPSGTCHEHVINGVKVPCHAALWREKTTQPEIESK